MSKEDGNQHSFRLNLNNPNHLLIHKTLNDLNKDIHKSKSNFIINALLKYINGYSEEELTNSAAEQRAKKEGYVTRKEIEDMENRITANVLKELTVLVCSSLIQRPSYVIPQMSERQTVNPSQVGEAEIMNEEKSVVDETLEDLAVLWSK